MRVADCMRSASRGRLSGMQMQTTVVIDAEDSRLDVFRALADRDGRRQLEATMIVAEGANVVARMLTSRHVATRVVGDAPAIAALVDRGLAGEFGPGVLDRVELLVVDSDMLADVVGFTVNQRIVGVGERAAPWTAHDVLLGARRVLLLEGLNDHVNLGVIFRTAHALGVDAVLLDRRCADPLYRRCVRTSMGWALHQPWAWVEDTVTAMADLRAEGFVVLATTPDDDAADVTDIPVGRRSRFAIALGAEGPGLSREALAIADRRVTIPMHSEVDSLNVAVAAGIIVHALRPRA